MGIFRKISTHIFFLAGIIVLIFVVWLSVSLVFKFGGNQKNTFPIYTVDTKSFTLFATERGVVSPAKISPINSKISSNQAKIVWLVKEGTHVKKGEIVARFDTKPFVDQLQKAEQDYSDAKATHVAAGKMLSLQKEEEDGKIEEAARKLEIAKIQANNIKNGSGPLKKKVFAQKLHQAKRTLEISQSELADFNVLLKKGHISTRERDKAGDKVSTAIEQLQVAQAEMDNFNTYVWPRMQREAELLVNAAKSNVLRVKRTGEILIQNRIADVEKSRRKVELKRKALQLSKVDVANCDITSPTDGILLYSKLPLNNNRRKIRIGDSVWFGQTFLKVPDTSALVADIYIREVDVARVSIGMTAEIVVDAFPGKVFAGELESVASLAKEDEEHSNIRRFYARIRFTGNSEKIHVGMSVTTRIIEKRLNNVIAVPISAVFFEKGKTMVRKKTDEKWERTQVLPGARGQLWVEIRDGLMVGDQIYSEGQ